ncbi:MAG: (2Fe-2S)-binding protein [Alphaproteobacteria bacterium]|nr:(2Fe-2S)-binding protein [Alphaproteobacteria bacterium]
MNGRRVVVGEEDTAASAILLAGVCPSRLSAVTAQPRAPYCMMGACFECLAEIDGVPLQQACLIPVREGMRIKTAGKP